MATFTTLTDGLFGGIAGALGASAAAVITIVLTRRGDRDRESSRLAEQEQQRRAELIAKLTGTMRALESEVRFAPFMGGRTQTELLQFVALFYAAERKEHPAVAQWVMDRHAAHGKLMGHWRRVWWVPVVRGRRLTAVGEHLGQTMAAINLWVGGDINDSWFEQRSGGRTEL